MTLNYSIDVDLPDQDTAYMNTLVLDHAEDFAQYKIWAESTALNDTLNTLSLPSNGKIVETGVWQHHFFNHLKTRFGDRAKGYDIHQYTESADDQVVYGDFRTIHSNHNEPVAVLINSMGGWDTNGSSKKAALDYAYTNLVSGGYYIDIAYILTFETPDMSAYPNLTLIYQDFNGFTVYRKE